MDLFNKLLINGESPFDSNGDVKQGYLFGFTKEAGRLVRDIYGSVFGNKEIDDFFDNVKTTSTPNIESMNMNYDEDYRKEIIAIKTKPFVLLAGISGTGKSRIVRTLAYKKCSTKELQNDQPGNFLLIKVKPNWHDSSELIGYVSRINSDRYVIQEFLRFLVKAWKYEEIPFLLCLDEMNLAPVEQYLAEYLSIVETRIDKEGKIITDAFVSKESVGNDTTVFEQLLSELGIENESDLWDQFFEKGITLPPNLIVIGTVNMDETTHSFSRKVLDRAMTIEMNDINLFGGLEETNLDWTYPDVFIPFEWLQNKYTGGGQVYSKFKEDADKVIEFLEKINVVVGNTPFKIAYRVRDEFLIYCYHVSLLENKPDAWLKNSLDEMTYMKILPRIEGDAEKTEVLKELKELFNAENLTRSLAKAEDMEYRRIKYHYTSFWS